MLLRNGNVLSGKVRKTGENYVVQRPDALVHLASYQVESVFDNLISAYVYQHRLLAPQQTAEHLKLAEWCVREGLLDEAELEVQLAAQSDPKHPRILIIQRRIAVARDPASFARRAAGESESVTTNSQKALISAKPTAHISSVLHAAETSAAPDDTMDRFRRTIQPLLLNTCTTSGCHRGGNEDSFVLDRRALWRDSPRRLTENNLSRTLAYIDREDPLKSPLLSFATTVHADSISSVPLARTSTSLELLEAWVLYTSGHGELATSLIEEEVTDRTQVDDDFAANVLDQELDEILPDDYREAPSHRGIRRGVRLVTGTADPFDPNEFNRRYSPRQGVP